LQFPERKSFAAVERKSIEGVGYEKVKMLENPDGMISNKTLDNIRKTSAWERGVQRNAGFQPAPGAMGK